MEENLKHRFYPLQLNDSDNSDDALEPSSRPQRVNRALCLLSGFDDAEYATYMQRRQDLYKSSQLCEKTKSMLIRKEKEFKVKVLMTQK